jgi:hypothetical protein
MARIVKIIMAGDVVIMTSMPNELARVIVVVARIVPRATAAVAVAATVTIAVPGTTVATVVVAPVMSVADVDVVAATGKVKSEVASLCGAAESRKCQDDSNDAR